MTKRCSLPVLEARRGGKDDSHLNAFSLRPKPSRNRSLAKDSVFIECTKLATGSSSHGARREMTREGPGRGYPPLLGVGQRHEESRRPLLHCSIGNTCSISLRLLFHLMAQGPGREQLMVPLQVKQCSTNLDD